MLGMPPAEFRIDATLVRGLLLAQFPDLADQPVEPFEEGWDNAIFRLGEHLLVRLPRRHAADALVTKEQRWLWRLPPLPLAIPLPTRVGRPGGDFPWHWSVVPWIPGETADLFPPAASEAERLAFFLRALHQTAPPDAPISPHRGCDLADRQATIGARLERLQATTTAVSTAVMAVWNDALAAQPSTVRTWVHGDLHARNALVHEGRLASVIDWGDLCAGDPATDLAAIWALFESPVSRQQAIECYGASPDLVARARGWVVALSTVLLHGLQVGNDRYHAMGANMLRRLEDDHIS